MGQSRVQIVSLLEEAHIKAFSIVPDLLGISARRMLQALAGGETDPAVLAARGPALARHGNGAMPSRRVRPCIRSTVGC